MNTTGKLIAVLGLGVAGYLIYNQMAANPAAPATASAASSVPLTNAQMAALSAEVGQVPLAQINAQILALTPAQQAQYTQYVQQQSAAQAAADNAALDDTGDLITSG